MLINQNEGLWYYEICTQFPLPSPDTKLLNSLDSLLWQVSLQANDWFGGWQIQQDEVCSLERTRQSSTLETFLLIFQPHGWNMMIRVEGKINNLWPMMKSIMPVLKEYKGTYSEGFWIAEHVGVWYEASCLFAWYTLHLYLLQYRYNRPVYMSFASYSSKKVLWRLLLYIRQYHKSRELRFAVTIWRWARDSLGDRGLSLYAWHYL